MPSVMTTTQAGCRRRPPRHRGLCEPGGGTKTTETSAPVSSTASATEPNTGSRRHRRPRTSTVWPPLPGVTPPTTLRAGGEHPLGVLAALGAGHALDDDPAVLGEQDRHVLVLTSLRSCSAASSAARWAAPSMVSTSSTTAVPRRSRMRRPSSALLPSSRTTSGLADLVAALVQQLERLHDAVGHRVAGGDAAEDVDEHRLAPAGRRG